MKKFLIFICALGVLCGAQGENLTKEQILQKYSASTPKLWGEELQGVIKNFKTDKKQVALTLDLCGSKTDDLDERIVEFLEKHSLKATFFVNLRWIEKFPQKFERLRQNPNFEIENHGTAHSPASLNGASIYGIKGTADAGELYDEIARNAELIARLTGARPKFYRSGTAYYDELAVAQIYDMGYAPVGFSVLGDAGATMSAEGARTAVSSARGGDIIIAHANHPEKPSGAGVVGGLKILVKNGFEFVRLDEVLE
ncbi:MULTISPECIES: polysaccharide deacetylase family protein [unclassified Campylobacter]|uniref:polysaccharide deacetylase family protein n=1 Tax=unclassified Campylobacter TaxID=2593542 RepID=UPI0022E9AC12|nr:MULTISPECIES: polysaccharide deacetylase family protein [unclassified Campylobacter]MDA3055175.1 polysaccharide deacetylase family protein [Campylobacter sp. VBCF_07 NA4]MDA3070944.1 polysaccharide deacetylase family protein [Campylobacter sp. VBCF_08 NA3]MDA3078792.1 polysaccharide deacetylase family protein [Campylobacter sp. JMF_06 NA1]WBR54084.1 polysaccharide deacetylase family protein [Campylobacter sp. VBCF_01 NA2]